MKKHGLAAFLSALVCPGSGQVVKGQGMKGIAILAALLLGLFLNVIVYVLLPLWSGVIFSAVLAALYLWNIYDAYC
jgi:TM2 domain-containing membrane protein YozV